MATKSYTETQLDAALLATNQAAGILGHMFARRRINPARLVDAQKHLKDALDGVENLIVATTK